MSMGLKAYKQKRNFSRTSEPPGRPRSSKKSRSPIFVVQKHAATRLHYDFRLEMQGVLKSWAVPKGFPTERGDRRLAIEVEDHPLEYGGFEGTIPEGNYGAGTVMLWDSGTYEVPHQAPMAALAAGKLHLILKGKKLRGEWHLVRTHRNNGSKPQWLLMKTGSDIKPFSEYAENRSVLSHRTLESIAKGGERQWQSNRAAKRNHRSQTRTRGSKQTNSAQTGSEKDQLRFPDLRARFVEPMKALLVDKLPKGSEWIYEIKFDGIRALAIKRNNTVHLVSRTAKDMTAKYPNVIKAIQSLPASECVLDGEIVALDAEGRPSFQLLQRYQMAGARKAPLYYYVFDLITMNGKDLTSLPLLKRKRLAETLVKDLSKNVRFSANLNAPPGRLITQMQQRGLEGLIAKQKNSNYEPGRRSGVWQKFKWTNEQEFVIGGYTPPKGSRKHFGAILVGYYEGNNLLFAAKVGTGFNEKLLASLMEKFRNFITANCPFANLPEKPGSHGRGLTRGEMARCTWLTPRFVCQVRFAEWTRDNHLRQPAFLGLREDKDPKEVKREFPQ